MTQTNMNTIKRAGVRTFVLWCLICVVTLLAGTVAYAGENRIVKARLSADDGKYINVQVNNCTVTIEPTDETYLECWYDTGALRFTQEVRGETQQIVLSSISGKMMGYDAAATIYLPRKAYNALMLEGRNAEIMVMKGFEGNQDYTLDNSRISVQFTQGLGNAYIIRLTSSTCDFAIPDTASNYAIDATVNSGRISVPAGSMPEYKSGSSYKYTNGDGGTVITVDLTKSSDMNFYYTRTAN